MAEKPTTAEYVANRYRVLTADERRRCDEAVETYLNVGRGFPAGFLENVKAIHAFVRLQEAEQETVVLDIERRLALPFSRARRLMRHEVRRIAASSRM